MCLAKLGCTVPAETPRSATVSELPSHPEAGPDTHPDSAAPDSAIAAPSRRRRALLITVVVALLVLIIVLHLTGVVGAGSN
jgi:hypothetical protein